MSVTELKKQLKRSWVWWHTQEAEAGGLPGVPDQPELQSKMLFHKGGEGGGGWEGEEEEEVVVVMEETDLFYSKPAWLCMKPSGEGNTPLRSLKQLGHV